MRKNDKMLDLEEIKRLCGGRTPGPWFIKYIATALRIMRKSGPDASDLEGYDDVQNCPRDEDAFFIAYMGTHADTLIAELTAARMVVDAAELFLDEFLSKKTCAPGALQRALNEYRSAEPQSPDAGREG